MSTADPIDLFHQRRVLVIGDVILDHYVRGSVSRTSPEAPVPILNVQQEEWLLGGAANVARNLTTLGARVALVGLCGNDDGGKQLRELLTATPRLKATLLTEKGRPTIVKTRCVAQGQQMLRLDREVSSPATDATVEKLKTKLPALISACDGVILSDYGKGVLRPDLIAEVIRLAKGTGKPVLVDPKGRDYARYRGASVLTPNQKEAAEATGVTITDGTSLDEAAAKLHRTVGGDAIVITRGAAGVGVYPAKGKSSHHPARAREVFDVTGAGDTFISVFALALFGGATHSEAALLGNIAGGIVVGMQGVACVSIEALREGIRNGIGSVRRKVRSREEIAQIVRSLRHHDRKIVFTNGFFDLLHHGHVRLLEEARRQGDCLIVAINSDAGTRRLKGAPRPILREAERVDLLSALPYVDHIVVFDEDTPESLLREIKPDVLVKGGAAQDRDGVVGHEIVEAYGGSVRMLQLDGDVTISGLIARVQSAGKKGKS